MSQKKSTKKISTTIRFKDSTILDGAREAAAIEDVSLNKFIVRSVVAATKRVKEAHSENNAKA
jgi:uncharacterized protein (DUF1778 family)